MGQGRESCWNKTGVTAFGTVNEQWETQVYLAPLGEPVNEQRGTEVPLRNLSSFGDLAIGP
jgi:hypothetical protein